MSSHAFYHTHTQVCSSTQRRQAGNVVLEIDWILEHATDLLKKLATMYSSVPEIPDSIPKLYHITAGDYNRQRERCLKSLLRNAQLLTYIISSLHHLTNSTNKF